MSRLLLLPEELLVATTHHLDLQDLKQFSLVNKQLHALCATQLFAKVTLNVPARPKDLSTEHHILSRYQTLRFVRVLNLRLGWQGHVTFQKHDFETEINNFVAFFAMVQASITDIHYIFYAQPEDSGPAPAKAFIGRILSIITNCWRIGSIRGHVGIGDDTSRARRQRYRGLLAGLSTALPHSRAVDHLYSLTLNGSELEHADASGILAQLPATCQLRRCRIRMHATLQAIASLPSSLQSLSITVSSWVGIRSDTWPTAFSTLVASCPHLVNLRIRLDDCTFAGRQKVLQQPAPTSTMHCPHLQRLDVTSSDTTDAQILRSFGGILSLLHAPQLSLLALKGFCAWYTLSVLDLDGFLKHNPVKELIRGEIIGADVCMTDSQFPWNNTASIPEMSQPLFNTIIQAFKRAGASVAIFAESPDDVSRASDPQVIRDSLATLQDHLTILELSLHNSLIGDPPRPALLDRLYRFPCLRHLRVFCHVPTALALTMRDLDTPHVEHILLVIYPTTSGPAAMIIGELTELLREGRWPRLLKISGEVEGMHISENEGETSDALLKWFKTTFQDVCASRGINTSELEGL